MRRPYIRQNLATPPWTHNPETVRAPDGTWVLYTLGAGTGSSSNPHGSVKLTQTQQPIGIYIYLVNSGTAEDAPLLRSRVAATPISVSSESMTSYIYRLR